MPTVVVRRLCFDQVGLFDENLRASEDYDMWLRICCIWKVGFIDEPLALYRVSPGQMSKNQERTLLSLLQVKNKVLLNNNPELRSLPLKVLDSYYYNYYTRLAKLSLKAGKIHECRQYLSSYVQVRGRTLRYWSLYWASYMPAWVNNLLIGLWDRSHQKYPREYENPDV
jgi:hypothetical protein